MYNYTPITLTSEKKYSLVSQDQNEQPSRSSSPSSKGCSRYHEEDSSADPGLDRGPRLTSSNMVLAFTTLLLLVVSTVQQVTIYQYQHPKDHYIISPYRTVLRQFGLETPYKSSNHTEAAEAWDRISSGHGDVAVDPAWAAAIGLPRSLQHPFLPEKRVYQLEAYHAMHCLKSLRNHYMTLRLPDARSVHPSFDSNMSLWDLEHELHCFDELRQHIMCNADDALMYSEGHRDIGWRQKRLCRDWDQLEAWAADNSACWKDHINPRPPGELWWHQCDDGDGLVRTGDIGL